jgi:hypothetical protein
MGKLDEILDFIYKHEYKITESSIITQKQRNELKYNLTEQVVGVLEKEGMDQITRTVDGYIIEIPNEELGSIYVQLDLIVKNLNYDILIAEQEWQNKVKEAKKKK